MIPRFPQAEQADGDDLIDVVSFNAAISACEKGQQWPGRPGASWAPITGREALGLNGSLDGG